MYRNEFITITASLLDASRYASRYVYDSSNSLHSLTSPANSRVILKVTELSDRSRKLKMTYAWSFCIGLH